MDVTFNFNYPPDLPVCAHRSEIQTALRRHSVIIVCGDTGSGKTTQLPKMALELRGGRVACTQPRRLAAVTMSERVANELKCPVGGLVGYRHRFGRKTSSDTRIEFMTDGVLLAETRFDPLLRAYDAIIVDEAHERSLNIDFLLGILKRILTRRRDLKLVISSATLDAGRFSAFFDNAPTVIVPGRLFPIEIGYRPPPEDEERDLARDVAAAVAELPPHDDILVFLPGERDIRETADELNDRFSGTDLVIPLLASLPAAEQRRAFQLSARRRIILATNVAETSVTIPGIRAVIDSGLARISRYIHRTQIQRLQIEPISQASARQRAGRCGRLGPGTCLRLYSEEDFRAREPYTPPEVLRTSLAGVILTMLDLKMGDIERFPFLDPPRPTMIREGLRELLELGAIEHRHGEIALTDIGRKLARFPVEPRHARMLIAGAQNAVLPSVIPLVAAMSCDDPRRRPIDEREKANQAHARFRVPGSDFRSTLKLWTEWTQATKDLSQSKIRKLCQANYLSYPKMREWGDLVRQLESLSRRLGLSFSTVVGQKDEDFTRAFHRSLLSGLLGRIGRWDEEERNYRGAHAIRFALHPASLLAKHPPPWIVAGELVDTQHLFAREAAPIDVSDLESVAGPICKHSYHSPEWDERFGFVRATEQVTLYGLVIVPARRCDYSRIDPIVSREVFIRRALIDGDFPQPPPAIRANRQLLGALRKLAERTRRPEILDENRLFEHFNGILPIGICSANALRKWLKDPAHADRLTLKKNAWWPRDGVSSDAFPEVLHIADAKIQLTYRHTPDDPERDGVTCSIRQSDVTVLKLWRPDWLVPGLLPEKIAWMLGTLPSALRRALAPLEDAATILQSILKPGSEPLEDAFRKAVNERWGFRIPEGIWDWGKLPSHLRMRFRVFDDKTGKTLLTTHDPNEILFPSSRISPSDANRETPVTTWAFGEIPACITDRNAGWDTTSYPALADRETGVILRRFDDPRKASESHFAGVARLFELALAKKETIPFRRNRINFDAACTLKGINYTDERIAADILAGAIREVLVRGRSEVRTAEEFNRRLSESHTSLVKTQSEISAILIASAAQASHLYTLLEDARIPNETRDAVTTQIAWLIFPGFLRAVPLATLRHYDRYLKGAKIRLERARLSPSADRSKEEKFAPYWAKYREIAPQRALFDATALDEFRWMLEEYRISLFAQELHTPIPISPKRLDAKWDTL